MPDFAFRFYTASHLIEHLSGIIQSNTISMYVLNVTMRNTIETVEDIWQRF